jgi:DMSO/TMAO reductase YedYZ molybdopterin-dependent catalytic subunit
MDEAGRMATALHPQTMLATKCAKEPITDPFGFPLRLAPQPSLASRTPNG